MTFLHDFMFTYLHFFIPIRSRMTLSLRNLNTYKNKLQVVLTFM